MNIYNVNNLPSKILIGEEAENIALGIGFDYSDWVETHGAGAVQLLLQRPQDTNPYPVTLTTEENVATWMPTSTDTAFNGFGKAQLIYTTANDVVEKSPVFYTVVDSSLEGAGDPPEPYDNWIDTLTDLASETLLNAQAAAASAEDAEEAKDEVVAEIPNFVWRRGEAVQIVEPTEVSFTLDSTTNRYKHDGGLPGLDFSMEDTDKNVYEVEWDGEKTILAVWGITKYENGGITQIAVLGKSTVIGERDVFLEAHRNINYVLTWDGESTYAIYTSSTAATHTISVSRIPITFNPIYRDIEPLFSKASGNYSLASQFANNALLQAIAIGVASYAAAYSLALGLCAEARGSVSTALGYAANASGNYAIAIGDCAATGADAVSIGFGASASSSNDMAIGVDATASGVASTALGRQAKATGNRAVAIGCVEAASQYQVAVGRYNVVDSSNQYAFILGNGTNASNRHNLFTIANDGTVQANGKTMALLEDIPTDAGEIEFDGTETYAADTVGSELKSIDSTLTSLAADVAGKQDAPSVAGTAGQVLGLDNSLNPVWTTPQSGGDVSDVQVDGSSVVTSGVANIPVASSDAPGVMKINSAYGINISSGGKYPYVASASSTVIKAGTDAYKPVAPVRQHEATYFGLAKAAGVDLANETVTVGTYPATAKTAIKGMLGVPEDAGDIPYDGTETYPADTVGSEISSVKSAIQNKPDIDLGITGATAGKYAKVKTVDANGKPTAWEYGTPSGGGGGDGWNHLFSIVADGVGNNGYFDYIIPISGYTDGEYWTTDGSVDLTTLTAYRAFLAPKNPEAYIRAGIKANALYLPITGNGNGLHMFQWDLGDSGVVLSSTTFAKILLSSPPAAFIPTDMALYVYAKSTGFGSYVSVSDIGDYAHFKIHVSILAQRGANPKPYGWLINLTNFANSNNLFKVISDAIYDLTFESNNYSPGVQSDNVIWLDRVGDNFEVRIENESTRTTATTGTDKVLTDGKVARDAYSLHAVIPATALQGAVELISCRNQWGSGYSFTPGSRIDIWGW